MPSKNITQLPGATSVADADVLHMVDVSDHSVSPAGLDVKVSVLQLKGAMYGAFASSQDVSFSTDGNTNITPATNSTHHWVVAEVGAGFAPFTRTLALVTTGRKSGDVVTIQLNMPSSSNPLLEIRNGTSGGTLIATVIGEPDGVDVIVVAEFDGTEWQPVFSEYQE